MLGSAAEMLGLLPQVPILVQCTAFHLLPEAVVVKITCLKLFLAFFALSWERRPLKRRKKISPGEVCFQRNMIRPLRESRPTLGPEAADIGHSSVTFRLAGKIMVLRMVGSGDAA